MMEAISCENENTRCSKRVQESQKKVRNSISSHGTSQIAHAQTKFSRITWTITFIVFLAFLLRMLDNVFRSFLSHDIYTVRNKIQNENVVFPAVSFCPTARTYESVIANMQRYYDQSDNNVSSLSTSRDTNRLDYASSIEKVMDITPRLETLFLEKLEGGCVFGNHSCKLAEDFETVPVSSYEGICYKFNHNGKFIQQGEGSGFGFSALIFLNRTEKQSRLPNESFLTLVVQSHDSFPFPLQNGILVSPGEYTSIRLKKTYIKRLPHPYRSGCRSDDYVIYPGKYTTWNCKRSCSTRYAIRQCGGADDFAEYHLGRKNNSLFPGSQLECFYKKQFEVSGRTCSCALPCEEDNFVPLITQSSWPSKADLPYYKQLFASAIGRNSSQMSDEYVYKNFLKINVVLEELAHEDISENSEWTYEKLVSDIGGQMGIWIGASLFSVMELIVYISIQMRMITRKLTKN